MGGIYNIQNGLSVARYPRRGRRSGLLRAIVATSIGLALLMVDSPVARADGPEPVAEEAAVSTSPSLERRPNSGPVSGPGPLERERGLPLTRAATRQRIDTMDPSDWLARFGAISVTRSE